MNDPVMDGRVVMSAQEAKAVYAIARRWPKQPITLVRDAAPGLVVQAGNHGYRVRRFDDRPGHVQIVTWSHRIPAWAPRSIGPLR